MKKRTTLAISLLGALAAFGSCDNANGDPVMPDDGRFEGSAVSFTVDNDRIVDLSADIRCEQPGETSTMSMDLPGSFEDPIEDGEFGFTISGGGLQFGVSGQFPSNDRAEGEYFCGSYEGSWTATR